MFVNKRHCHERHGGVVNWTEIRREAEYDERGEHHNMQKLRETQASRDSEFHNQRADSFTPIKIVILRRVNQIEPGHPANNSSAENKRCKIDMSGLRDPRADRRNGEGETEKEMSRGSEAFGNRVEKYNGERKRRQ